MVKRLTGLQRDVLYLYRQYIRMAYKKPEDSRPHFLNFVRGEFRKNSNLSRREFNAIEYLIRTGKRRLEMYQDPTVKDIS